MGDKVEKTDQGTSSLDEANRVFDLVLKMNALEESASRPSAQAAPMMRRMAAPSSAPFSNSNAIRNQMEQNLNLEGFQQLDETSEYRETHYYSNE